jgi:hypothetical protein
MKNTLLLVVALVSSVVAQAPAKKTPEQLQAR